MVPKRVTIAPLVLLSVVDHYKRHSAPRVVGVLLGSTEEDATSITNSFAIPFEESEESFFIDTSYLKNMFELFHKVNCTERIVGWYHSGPRMHRNDLEISKAFTKYCDDPFLAIIDVEMKASDIPVQIYRLALGKELQHTNVQIGADETEEVGVEHLLRDIKEGTGCSLKDQTNEILDSLRMYGACLDEIVGYIEDLERGRRADFSIVELLQDILNEVPKLGDDVDLSRIYSIELINTLLAMNELQRNRVE